MNKKLLLIPLAIGLVAWIIIKTVGGHGNIHGTKCEMEALNSNPADTEAPKAVTVILDNSGSMQGYLNFAAKGDDFADARQTLITNVQDFMGNVDSRCKVTSSAICGTESYESVGKLANSMRDYSAFRGAVTELDKLVEMAIEKAGDTSVSVIVTDMVMSYGRQAFAARNEEHLNEHEIGRLAGDIGNKFKGLKEKHIGALILKYESAFNGNYYYNCTENIINGGEFKGTLMNRRPYYFFVIGKDSFIKNLCLNNCFPEPDEAYSTVEISDKDFVKQTFTFANIPSGWIVGDVNNPEAAGKKVCIWTNADFGDTQGVFDISFPAIKLPLYARGDVVADWDSDVISNVTVNPGLDGLKATLIPFKSLKPEDDAEIEIKIKRNTDNVGCSVDKDYNMEAKQLEGKTWGFANFLSSIYAAYDIENGETEEIAELSFDINKE